MAQRAETIVDECALTSVVCELISLIGSYTVPGQHNQPTLTLLGRGCVCDCVQPATCSFGRMTRVFYMPLW